MNTAAILAMALVAAPYPDEMDILRTTGVKPRMNLLLDSSCSMRNGGTQSTECGWFGDNHNGGNTNLNKNQIMRAVLVGCKEEGDGILDKWVESVQFSVADFRGRHADFGSDISALRTAVLGIPTSGGTPLTATLDAGGEYMGSYSTDDNTDQCAPFFQLLLSDGDPNGGAAVLDQECTTPVESRAVGANQPWLASEYLNDRHEDVLCSMVGNQTIQTYTLGFGKAGSFNPTYLQRIAEEGGGEYYYAASVPELVAAFDTIMAKVATKGQAFAQVSVGQDTYFAEDRAYTASLQPSLRGPWTGNLRKICVLPELLESGLYSTTDKSCLLHTDDGELLLTNPDVVDQWTGLPYVGTQLGGAGEILTASLAGATDASAWERRNIVTWRPGTAEWVKVHPDTWTEADAWVSGCDRYRLLAHLHGYTWDADCDAGVPIEARTWALGDAIHAGPLELRYGDCDTGSAAGGDGCLVMFAANDGQIHVFDVATGAETSAIIPAELWKPGGWANSTLGQIMEQPSVKYSHRYYIDGALRLSHDDLDGDGIIDPSEKAWVVFSLGRGGRAYYALSVSDMADGIVDDGVEIFPLLPTPGTALRKMTDTWTPPVLVDVEVAGATHAALALSAGHYAQFSITERTELIEEIIDDDDDDDDEDDGTRTTSCADIETYNGYSSGEVCSPFYTPGCAGTVMGPCYDGYGIPLDAVSPPFTISEDGLTPVAIKLGFAQLDLDPGDELYIQDEDGNVAGVLTSASAKSDSPWVYSSHVVLRLVTNGVDHGGRGYTVNEVKWVGKEATSTVETDPASLPEPILGVSHHPTVFLVDLDKFNGSAPQAFASASSDDGVLLEVTAECDLSGDRCLDASDAEDLVHLVCPISGEIVPYVQQGRAEAFYFGDECAQIWKVYTPDGGDSWTAKRLAVLNDGPLDYDKDHRKIFQPFDLVDSQCPGRTVVGIYFGTGNLQRPLAADELEDPDVTDGFDVVGVLWDYEGLATPATPDDFMDATSVDAIDPLDGFTNGKVGWMMRLRDDERMLKAPLVLDGVAYFRTFQPDIEPTACEAGTGIDRIYAVDNCTVQATGDDTSKEARELWSSVSNGGAELLLITPSHGAPFVTHGDASQSQRASLGDTGRSRPDIMFWREIP